MVGDASDNGRVDVGFLRIIFTKNVVFVTFGLSLFNFICFLFHGARTREARYRPCYFTECVRAKRDIDHEKH